MERKERIERAKKAFAAHKDFYYSKGEYRGADFWDFAEIFEIVDDLYETTGDASLPIVMREMYDHTVEKYGHDWETNIYNDDIMWLVIAYTRAYLLTGNRQYLEDAVLNFNKTFERSADDTLGGGLYWTTGNFTKNSCVNGPGAVAACYLAKATGDDSYYAKAEYCNDFLLRNMFEKDTGMVYDSLRLTGECRKWASTYNQGTFMGANLLLFLHDGKKEHLEYAKKAVYYCMETMYGGGIMNNEEEGNDLPGFKGILARYIRLYTRVTGDTKPLAWLEENAASACKMANTRGLMNTQLAMPTSEREDQDVFAMSAAVSVAVNAIG